MTADVLVVGGGLSGLAAAVRLSLDGAHVTLVEQANKLGGRAYSYVDRATGDVVDNGQHILVGAYHATLRYLDLIGSRHRLSSPEDFQLHFHHPSKGFETFTLRSRRSPFHFLGAAWRFRLLSISDRLKLMNVGLHVRRKNEHLERTLQQMTVAQWLQTLKQTDEAARWFWYPIAISVMNELPEKASASLFARSLANTFFGNPSDATILIPTAGQTELYADGAMTLLSSRRAKVMMNTEVKSILMDKQRPKGAVLKNGKVIRAKTVICAVPYFALGRLLPDHIRRIPSFAHIRKFHSSPIVSIHLWFDRPVMDRDFVGLVERKTQWIFNRRRILQEYDKPENYVSAVISGAHDYIQMSKEHLAKLAAREIRSAFPQASGARMIHSIVIKEKRATFSPTTDVEPFRPSQESPVKNLFLAGDWTNTGLPPTIEGAIMSGFRCAELVGRG